MEVILSDFDSFWQAYPNKKAKGAARRAFNTAIKRAEFGQIIAGLEAYKANKEPWRTWMHPATWLNGECWDDEYETAPEVAAAFRSYDTWTEKDKQECAAVVSKWGIEKAVHMFRYTYPQIERLRAEEYLQPREATA